MFSYDQYKEMREQIKVGDTLNFFQDRGLTEVNFTAVVIEKVKDINQGYFRIKIIKIAEKVRLYYCIGETLNYELLGGYPWNFAQKEPFTDEEYSQYFV